MPADCSLSSVVAKSGTCSRPWSRALLGLPGAARPLTACSGLSCTCISHTSHCKIDYLVYQGPCRQWQLRIFLRPSKYVDHAVMLTAGRQRDP